MKSILRISIAVLILLAVAGAVVWGFLAGRSEQAAEEESDAPIQSASRITQQNGKTVLAFDAQAQRANGITVVKLGADRRRAAAEANGVVLQLQPLLDLKTRYNTGHADLAKARAASQASQAEYKRLTALNQSGDNIAAKAVEAARAAAESDAATVENAEQTLAVLKSSIQMRWGPAVAAWLQNGSPQFDELLAQREFLLQVTPANYAGQAAPADAVAKLAGGAHLTAHLVAALPQLDPRLQAPSYLYTVPAHAGLIPGMNLSVSLPLGPLRSGVIVPDSAVVWQQGGAWCYVEEQPGEFTREPLATDNPASSGWFESEGIPAGALVVTAGAQTLLSEEFRSQIRIED